MPFGKHKNKEVKELPLTYCWWLIKENVLKDKKYIRLKSKIQERLQQESIFYGSPYSKRNQKADFSVKKTW